MSLTHDALAADLAGHLRTDRRMTWCDVQLGPSGSVRPDVYAIYKSYSNPCPTAYECKVSLPDFRSDVTSGKWQSYLRYASAVYFACEAGLISKADVPTHCGLMLLKDGRWRAAKRAVYNPVTIPEEALLKLLIDGIEREGPHYRVRRWAGDSAYFDKIRSKFGEIVARTVRDRLAMEHEIESARRTAELIEEDARVRAEKIRSQATMDIAPARAELCEVLGLPEDANQWRMVAEVKRIRQEIAEHPAHASLRTLTNVLRRALDQHGYRESEVDIEVPA